MIELQLDLEYVVCDRLKVSLDAIAQFCQRWKIVEFALFGSVLRINTIQSAIGVKPMMKLFPSSYI
jgi:hypothetical protein